VKTRIRAEAAAAAHGEEQRGQRRRENEPGVTDHALAGIFLPTMWARVARAAFRQSHVWWVWWLALVAFLVYLTLRQGRGRHGPVAV